MTDYYELIKNKIYEILVKNNHIYNLNRNKIDYFYEINDNFKDIVDYIVNNLMTIEDYNYDYDLEKFDKLFINTRFCNLPSVEIFKKINLRNADNYNVKIINEVKKLRIFNNVNDIILYNIVLVFGLFEKDKYVYSRLQLLIRLFRIKTYFNEEDYKILNIQQSLFEKKIKNEYMIKEESKIPDFLNPHFKRYMYEYDVATLDEIEGDIRVLANDFFEQNYVLKEVPYFYLKGGITGNELKEIYNYILSSDVSNQFTTKNINRIFGYDYNEYNEKALMFFIKNLKIILENKLYQSKIKDIYNNFDEISNFFKAKGNCDFSFEVAFEYAQKYEFTSNQEFLTLIKNSGVKDQEIQLKYSQLYIDMKKRTISSIPKLNYEYIKTINGIKYKIKFETLNYNDPFALLIGESNYMDCCQKYGSAGESCMVHAVTEGRIFCVYLLDEKNNKILLADSWIWRRGNMLCFDNVEGSNTMKNSKIYHDLVADAYVVASNYFLEISKQFSDNLEVICVGRGYGEFIDDLGLENYFKEKNFNTIKPYGYDAYLDSQIIYFIKGKKEQIKIWANENKLYTDEEKQYKKIM